MANNLERKIVFHDVTHLPEQTRRFNARLCQKTRKASTQSIANFSFKEKVSLQLISTYSSENYQTSFLREDRSSKPECRHRINNFAMKVKQIKCTEAQRVGRNE